MAKQKTIEIPAEVLDSTYSLDSNFPSTITDGYWVIVEPNVHLDQPRKLKEHKQTSKKNDLVLPHLTESYVGKWLVFIDIGELDTTWQKIKQATQNGVLGIAAKAATAKPNPNASSQNEKVICVYTYNWLDKDDVFRVESKLRSLGISQTLYYKTDSDTLSGQYKAKEGANISKYISKGTKKYSKYALETLVGVGCAKSKILHELGIKTFDDLLAFDTSIKLTNVGVSVEYINKLKLVALSQIENKIFKLSAFDFPETDILHFDIETDINTPHEVRRVWSIAVHHRKKLKHFYAETWQQEKKILSEFLKYLKSCKDIALFSYSSFDISVLKHALTRHKLDAAFFMNLNHFDLCAVLKQHYILPLDSYSVKEVGRFFGYRYKDQSFDGIMAAMEYMSTQMTGRKISKALLNYIQDDVKVMHHIVEELKTRKDIKDVFDY